MHHAVFHFSGYYWNHHAGKICLQYGLDDDIQFEEIIKLPEPVSDERLKAREWEIERLLFALHIIGGISYFKTTIPRTISVESGALDKAQVKFWNSVYEHGLGEFFFQNDIDFRGLIKFPEGEVDVQKDEAKNRMRRSKKIAKPVNKQRLLVPIGGGKDSMVTVELLKKAGADVTLLRLGSHPIIDQLAHAAGLPMLTVDRSLSPKLFEMNAKGALNGHVPITAYLSILSVLVAELYDFDCVVMSNERSADEGNVLFKGLTVNHQWSKSQEFERMLRRYLTETVKTEIEYFSAVRPFSELKISEMFGKLPQYFQHVTSCNRNWKILAQSEPGAADQKRWCSACPKCAFVFSCLAATMQKKTLMEMFGSNLYEDPSLLPLFRELLGIEKFKPFECVGTSDETKAAFLLAHRKKEYEGTPAMQMFVAEVLPSIKEPDSLIAESLKPSKEHCIPLEFKEHILHSSL